MEKRYSIFDAKARFSELVRVVRANGQVVITQRGVPVIRLIPYTTGNESMKQRLSALASIGKARLARKAWPRRIKEMAGEGATKVPAGAVQRFLDDRE